MKTCDQLSSPWDSTENLSQPRPWVPRREPSNSSHCMQAPANLPLSPGNWRSQSLDPIMGHVSLHTWPLLAPDVDRVPHLHTAKLPLGRMTRAKNVSDRERGRNLLAVIFLWILRCIRY